MAGRSPTAEVLFSWRFAHGRNRAPRLSAHRGRAPAGFPDESSSRFRSRHSVVRGGWVAVGGTGLLPRSSGAVVDGGAELRNQPWGDPLLDAGRGQVQAVGADLDSTYSPGEDAAGRDTGADVEDGDAGMVTGHLAKKGVPGGHPGGLVLGEQAAVELLPSPVVWLGREHDFRAVGGCRVDREL